VTGKAPHLPPPFSGKKLRAIVMIKKKALQKVMYDYRCNREVRKS
jgi:hypothetical protein